MDTQSTTPEQLNDLRARVLAGQDVSVDEYRTLIMSLRQQRSGDIERAQVKSPTAKRALTPKVAVELPDILKDL